MRKVVVWYGPHHQRVWVGDCNRDWSPFASWAEALDWCRANGYKLVSHARPARVVPTPPPPAGGFCNSARVEIGRRWGRWRRIPGQKVTPS